MTYYNGLAAVAADAHFGVHGYLAQEGRTHRIGQLLAATGAENVHAGAIGQFQVGHILDDAQDGNFQLAEHVQAATGVFKGNKLWQGHDNRAAQGQSLRQG